MLAEWQRLMRLFKCLKTTIQNGNKGHEGRKGVGPEFIGAKRGH